jgi:hypothetical protein
MRARIMATSPESFAAPGDALANRRYAITFAGCLPRSFVMAITEADRKNLK